MSRSSMPDDAVAVEDERLDGIHEGLLIPISEQVHAGSLDDGGHGAASGGADGGAAEGGVLLAAGGEG